MMLVDSPLGAESVQQMNAGLLKDIPNACAEVILQHVAVEGAQPLSKQDLDVRLAAAVGKIEEQVQKTIQTLTDQMLAMHGSTTGATLPHPVHSPLSENSAAESFTTFTWKGEPALNLVASFQ